MIWRRGAIVLACALLLAAGPFLGCGAEEPAAVQRPTGILVVTLDTTRADHLGAYGYPYPTSPVLDALAARSIVYERAWSTSSWTLPAHASLFTGMFPESHGCGKDPHGELLLSEAIAAQHIFRARPLRGDVPTLAETLRANGYETGAVVGGPWLKRVFGLDRGFDFYDDQGIDDVNGRRASDVSAKAIAWLRERKGPFFLFLNYFDAHWPYQPPSADYEAVLTPERARSGASGPLADLVLAYDGEIHQVDTQLGAVLAELRGLGLYDSTWIVVTADHGELQGEHESMGHGKSLFEPEVRIPLIVKPAGRGWKPSRSRLPMQLTDVMPQILDTLGIAIPASVQGSARPGEDRAVFAAVSPLPHESAEGATKMVVEGDWKLVTTAWGQPRLFDLARDPGELHDLGPDEPERLASLQQRLGRHVASLPPPPPPGAPAAVDPQTREALRNLGYLEP